MGHDQRFKDLVVDYPREALRLFAPHEAGDLPANAIVRPVRQEKLAAYFGDARRFMDVPLEVSFPSGEREAVAFVVEEETVARFFDPARLGHYLLDLSALLRTTRVAAVVVYLRGPPRVRALRLGTERRLYLQLEWSSCVLPQLEASVYEDSDNLVARLNLMNMRHDHADRLRLYGAAFEGLVRLEPDPRKREKYSDFIDAYACLTEEEMLRFEEEELARREDAALVGYWETRKELLRSEGRVEGLVEGRQEGRVEGRVEGQVLALLRIISARGFALPADVRARIQNERDSDQLLRWTDRAVTMAAVDELFIEDA